MGTKAALTVADLAKLPPLRPEQGHHYELSDGELIVVGNAGYKHERVKSRITEMLVLFKAQKRMGAVFAETQFSLQGDCARQPDVAFVYQQKLDAHPVTHQAVPFAPDLAVEVISESETAAEAEKKVQEYLTSGVSEVWQVFPDQGIVHVRTRESIQAFRDDDILTSPVLPGFSARASDFFE